MKQDCTAGQDLGPNKTNKNNKTEGGPGGTEGLRPLSRAEQEIFDRLAEVGAFKTANSEDGAAGNWFVFVQRRLGVARRLLAALGERQQRSDLAWVTLPGAWMNREWHLWGRPDK